MSTLQPEKVHYAGYLYRLTSGRSFVETINSSSSPVLVNEFDTGYWKYFWYKSHKNLLSEAHSPVAQTADGTYDYPFLLRESEDRFILLSLDESLVTGLTKELRIPRVLQKPKIDIEQLVRDLVTPPQRGDNEDTGREYLMARVWASVDGYGRALRSMSFSGDDLAEAQLFSSTLKSVSPFRVILRGIKTNQEIVNIGSNGELSILYRGSRHLDELDKLLKFLTRGGYITW